MGQPTGVTVLTHTRPAAKPIPTQRVRVNNELEKNTPLGIPRLEHGYTRGSQVCDPYPYPWDTHYPNTNAGLDTGTDPQMRVAV